MSRLVRNRGELSFLLLVAACNAADDDIVDSEGADQVADSDDGDSDVPGDSDTDPGDSDTDVAVDDLVANGSFDDPALDPSGSAWTVDGADPATGWSFDSSTSNGGSAGVARPTTDDFAEAEPLASPADGNQALWLQTDLPIALRSTIVPTAVIASVRSEALGTVAASTTYAVHAAFGRRTGSALPDHVVLSLVAGDTTVDTIEVDPVTIPEGGWTELGLAWRSTASKHGKELRVEVTATTTFSAEGSAEVWVDAVRMGAR
jgi:hypothetical protein